jgi:cytochrome c556
MRGAGRRFGLAVALCAALGSPAIAADKDDDHDMSKLPPGPIRDRVELMHHVGDDAKAIGKALKAGTPADAAAPAEDIAARVPKFPTLFPPGSTSPESRAKPEIWTDKAKFDGLAKQLAEKASAFAAAAKSGGDVKATSGAMWQTCKACHDSFRVPKEGE